MMQNGRIISPAEQLRQSPRLVPPRGGGVSSEKMAYDFFAGRKTPYRQRWASEGHQRVHKAGGTPRGVGRAPTLVDGGWPPSGISSAQYFLLIPKITFMEFQDF